MNGEDDNWIVPREIYDGEIARMNIGPKKPRAPTDWLGASLGHLYILLQIEQDERARKLLFEAMTDILVATEMSVEPKDDRQEYEDYDLEDVYGDEAYE